MTETATQLSAIAIALANTAYALGARVNNSGNVYKCTTATSGDATETVL